jgi:hypothetical protein
VGAAAVCGANPSLDSLPEIERENILAARQEEIQKFEEAT